MCKIYESKSNLLPRDFIENFYLSQNSWKHMTWWNSTHLVAKKIHFRQDLSVPRKYMNNFCYKFSVSYCVYKVSIKHFHRWLIMYFSFYQNLGNNFHHLTKSIFSLHYIITFRFFFLPALHNAFFLSATSQCLDHLFHFS